MSNEAALEALVLGNDDFDDVERALGVFCPFEAVGMVRQEIRHAHFLQYCLDPERPHGFGTEPLRALMRAAALGQRKYAGVERAADVLTPLDVHLMQFEKAEIRREWRRIDLIAVVNELKLVIAFELKIEAAEHSGQLGRYRDVIAEQWPASAGWQHILLFLTLDGEEPSEDGAGWLPLGLDVVAREFETITSRKTGSPAARAMLEAYVSMLRRNFLTEPRLTELANRLWGQHREALDFLMEHRPQSDDEIATGLFERRGEIAQRMSEASGLTILVDSATPRLIKFAVEAWDDLPEFKSAIGWTSSKRLILLELSRDRGSENRGIRFVLLPGTVDVRLRYFEALQAAGRLSAKTRITQQFTRLANQSLPVRLDDLSDDPDAINRVVEGIIAGAVQYARERIPAFDRALAALRS